MMMLAFPIIATIGHCHLKLEIVTQTESAAAFSAGFECNAGAYLLAWVGWYMKV